VADGSEGKAHVLVTNRNLLIVADVLIVNKGFAAAHGDIVAGLVAGMLEGNHKVRTDPDACLPVIAKAFGWETAETKEELAKVHLANLPENRAFFAGTIDSAGSYGGIYESAVLAYGKELVPNPVDGEKFLDLKHLEAIEAAGTFKDQKASVTPIRSSDKSPVEGDPLLSRDIRFFFAPNSSDLDMNSEENLKNLESITKMLQVSPGSMVLLRGHVDNAKIPEFRKSGGEALVRSQALKAMELSKKRAEEIARLLVQKHRVDPGRIEKTGRGWEEPAGTDSDQNRRVEVQWFTLE
jgi:NitT/TauT family transport system substrate-binding protein